MIIYTAFFRDKFVEVIIRFLKDRILFMFLGNEIENL